MWVVKIDGTGKTMWQRTFGAAGIDYAKRAQATRDGGVIVAGAAGNDSRVWVLKLAADGTTAWDWSMSGGAEAFATGLAVLPARHYAVAAVTRDRRGAPHRSRLIKLTPAGKPAWQRQFGGDGTAVWITDLKPARAGGLVLVGAKRASVGAPYALWAARLDRDGALVWERSYPGAGADSSAFVRRAKGHQYIIATTREAGPARTPGANGSAAAGTAKAQIRLVRLTDDGDKIWDFIYRSPRNDRAAGLALVRGGIVVAGNSSPAAAAATPPQRSLWLMRFDTKGAMVWRRELGDAAAGEAGDLQQVRRGFVVAGKGAVLPGETRGRARLRGRPRRALSQIGGRPFATRSNLAGDTISCHDSGIDTPG